MLSSLMSWMKCGRDTRGVCLTELLVALSICLVVVSMSFETLGSLEHRFQHQHQSMAMAQDTRLGLEVFERDLQSLVGQDALSEALVGRADSDRFEFLANVNNLETKVTVTAAPGQQEIVVEDGSGWPAGKHVRLCGQSRCVENRLARSGQAARLSLEWPLTEALSAGSEVTVINQVRYYVMEGANGAYKLMRQVDGGANPLIGDLREASFHYRTREGRDTADAGRVGRVRLELSTLRDARQVSKEMAVRY